MLQTQSILHEEVEKGGEKPNQMDGVSFSISAADGIDWSAVDENTFS